MKLNNVWFYAMFMHAYIQELCFLILSPISISWVHEMISVILAKLYYMNISTLDNKVYYFLTLSLSYLSLILFWGILCYSNHSLYGKAHNKVGK